ncbi:hypothetical protein BKA69DRAFT_630639 [Paraphysoderma sedebokerense]|nr:hypothetical protein BKA69DRAFT_630639 [Paraphysoderma sedebokerense]
MWFLFHFPLWSIPVTYISIVVCLYCYYHDYKKCTLAPAASHIQSVRSLHKVGTGLCDLSDWPHSLRPNFHYALTYGICAIIPVVLAQLYIRTACVSFTKGFGRCISYDLSDVKTSSSHILWKLMFRLWTSIFSFIMEGISVFAFSDYHFLHRSYYWRFIEDLTVCVALVTENDVSLLLTHLGLNFVFVVLKDGGLFFNGFHRVSTTQTVNTIDFLPPTGAVDDIIWSLISKRWIYSKLSSDSAEDFTLSLKSIQEVRSQIIRSKLNFVSRISSISCIGTIALLDKTLFTHGEPIWQMAELTNIVLAVSVVLVQVTASRQLNRLIFARKELFMKDITSIFRINVDVLRDQLYSPNYNSQDVVTGWRLYLSLVSLLAVFVVFIDLHHLPT